MLDAVQLQRILPHRFPFLLVDGVESVDLEAEEPSIVAFRMISVSDPIVQGHFPGNPIVPGVLQVESMAQTAVVLAHLAGKFDHRTHHCLFAGVQTARFRAPVVPGERLEIRVRALRLGRVGKFEGEARVGDQVKSSAGFTAIIQAKSTPAESADASSEDPAP